MKTFSIGAQGGHKFRVLLIYREEGKAGPVDVNAVHGNTGFTGPVQGGEGAETIDEEGNLESPGLP